MTYLAMTRGDDAEFTITATNAAGAALDLTGASLRWTAKRDVDDSDDDAIIAKTSAPDGGITIDADPETGLAVLALVPGDTEPMTRDTLLVWDMQAVDVDGKVKTLASGALRVSLDVTRTAP